MRASLTILRPRTKVHVVRGIGAQWSKHKDLRTVARLHGAGETLLKRPVREDSYTVDGPMPLAAVIENACRRRVNIAHHQQKVVVGVCDRVSESSNNGEGDEEPPPTRRSR